MKTFTLLPPILCISQLINLSCSNDCADNNNRDKYLIIGKQIAKISEDEIILTSDQNSLNVDIKNIIDPQKKNNQHYFSSSIICIENNYYLRSYSTDSMVTTTLLDLEKDHNNNSVLTLSGISCSSYACISNNGCIPNLDKKTCSDCYDDCKKTITSTIK